MVNTPKTKSKVGQIRIQRLYEQVAGRVVEMIHDTPLAVGDRLPSEFEIARMFGVSRLPVREAMVALETAGIVTVRSGDGTFVTRRPDRRSRLPWTRDSEPDPGPVEQFRARRLLEPVLAAEAARSATHEQVAALDRIAQDIARAVEANKPIAQLAVDFHAALAEASGVALLAQLMPQLLDSPRHGMWATLRTRTEVKEYSAESTRFRRNLVEALRKRDATRARELVQRHLDAVGLRYFGADDSLGGADSRD
jgi:DNA-binding FadR family transcriptional regulator